MYRGLQLSKLAISTYKQLKLKEKEFYFPGFTSTSKNMNKALYDTFDG